MRNPANCLAPFSPPNTFLSAFGTFLFSFFLSFFLFFSFSFFHFFFLFMEDLDDGGKVEEEEEETG